MIGERHSVLCSSLVSVLPPVYVEQGRQFYPQTQAGNVDSGLERQSITPVARETLKTCY